MASDPEAITEAFAIRILTSIRRVFPSRIRHRDLPYRLVQFRSGNSVLHCTIINGATGSLVFVRHFANPAVHIVDTLTRQRTEHTAAS